MNQAQPASLFDRLRNRARPFWSRPRLSIAALVFLLMLFVGEPILHVVRSLLLAFDVAAAFFLLTTVTMMARSTPASMQRRAQRQREGRWVVLGVSMMVSLVTLIAVGIELHSKSTGSLSQVILAAATIVLSWLFVNTMFALHYAHAFHDVHDTLLAGLMFPGTDVPDYWDFMYFAFVIGMTFQVSDVQISSHVLRRLVLLHGLIAFFFNVVIIALTVNIVAGLG